MSPARIRRRPGRGKPSRSAKPITLPTFSFYGHLPVIYVDGELVVGRRVIPMEARR